MALPHLIEKNGGVNNFKTRREADFITRIREENDRISSYERTVREQTKFENFNSYYDKLISDDAYEKSLSSYIELRQRARKAEELVSRRERLAELLREEHEAHLNELKNMNTPECSVLYDDIRQKGFFELLYEDNNDIVQKRRLPRHLVSEYEADLHENNKQFADDIMKENRKREQLRLDLLAQVNEKKLRQDEEKRRAREEELLLLRNLRLVDEIDHDFEKKHKKMRQDIDRRNISALRETRQSQAVLDAASEEAMRDEAMRMESMQYAREAMDRAKRETLLGQCRSVQAEQIHELEEKKKLSMMEKTTQNQEMQRLNQMMEAERRTALERKAQSARMTRATYNDQLMSKYSRIKNEAEIQIKEREDEIKAEQAYHRLLEEESRKIKDRKFNGYRYHYN